MNSKIILLNNFFTKARVINSVSAALLISAALFCLSWSGEHLLTINNLPQKVDVIVVLGYPAEKDGSPSLIMKNRVAKGVELFQAGYAPRIIFSGAAVQNEFIEAELMADYAKSLGLQADAVILEKRARNTGENTWYSWLIMSSNGWSKALVVTTPYHTKRVANFFSKYPVEIRFVPADLPSDYEWFYKMYRVTYEYVAIMYYTLKGLLCSC